MIGFCESQPRLRLPGERRIGKAMILLRHCQSEFNLHFTRTRCDPGIVDPALTAEGLIQAPSDRVVRVLRAALF